MEKVENKIMSLSPVSKELYIWEWNIFYIL